MRTPEYRRKQSEAQRGRKLSEEHRHKISENSGTKRHGLYTHAFYGRWLAMMHRCYTENDPGYNNYGGRGIRVHDEWHDPAIFIAYLNDVLGPCPDGYSMDRINNDGDYAPGNLRWANRSQQNRNKRPRRPQSHCKNGHPYTLESTGHRLLSSGKTIRQCRICKAASRERYRARQRMAA